MCISYIFIDVYNLLQKTSAQDFSNATISLSKNATDSTQKKTLFFGTEKVMGGLSELQTETEQT